MSDKNPNEEAPVDKTEELQKILDGLEVYTDRINHAYSPLEIQAKIRRVLAQIKDLNL